MCVCASVCKGVGASDERVRWAGRKAAASTRARARAQSAALSAPGRARPLRPRRRSRHLEGAWRLHGAGLLRIAEWLATHPMSVSSALVLKKAAKNLSGCLAVEETAALSAISSGARRSVDLRYSSTSSLLIAMVAAYGSCAHGAAGLLSAASRRRRQASRAYWGARADRPQEAMNRTRFRARGVKECKAVGVKRTITNCKR